MIARPYGSLCVVGAGVYLRRLASVSWYAGCTMSLIRLLTQRQDVQGDDAEDEDDDEGESRVETIASESAQTASARESAS